MLMLSMHLAKGIVVFKTDRCRSALKTPIPFVIWLCLINILTVNLSNESFPSQSSGLTLLIVTWLAAVIVMNQCTVYVCISCIECFSVHHLGMDVLLQYALMYPVPICRLYNKMTMEVILSTAFGRAVDVQGGKGGKLFESAVAVFSALTPPKANEPANLFRILQFVLGRFCRL